MLGIYVQLQLASCQLLSDVCCICSHSTAHAAEAARCNLVTSPLKVKGAVACGIISFGWLHLCSGTVHSRSVPPLPRSPCCMAHPTAAFHPQSKAVPSAAPLVLSPCSPWGVGGAHYTAVLCLCYCCFRVCNGVALTGSVVIECANTWLIRGIFPLQRLRVTSTERATPSVMS
jgi:hypothetical protein